MTLQTIGNQTITATDISGATPPASAAEATVAVSPTSASYLTVLTTDPVGGTPVAVTVTAYDKFGNVDTGYTGTIHFSSSDAAAGLPSNYTFTSTDAGVHTFYVTLMLESVGRAGPNTDFGVLSPAATFLPNGV